MKKANTPRANRAERVNRKGNELKVDQAPVQAPQGDPVESLLKPFSFDGWGFEMPEMRTAENRAELAEIGVSYFEKHGREDLAAEDRAEATWWRELPGVTETSASPHYARWERDARDSIDALLVQAEAAEGSKAFTSLSSLLYRLMAGFHALAAHGNQTAARMWANEICRGVNDFEMLATAKPEIFKEWARGSFAIPGMISRNAEKREDNQRLCKLLEQGEATEWAILPTGKRGWNLEQNANGLAARLQSHIQSGRELYELHKVQSRGNKLPDWLEDAMKLAPFSPETWRTWAELAWRIIAEISPEGKPGLHPAFYHSKTKICNPRKQRINPYYANTESAPSIAENDIKEALFGAFELIATGKSRKTKERKMKTLKARKPA